VHLLDLSLKEKLRIIIFGDGPYKNELLKKISNFKLEHNFIFKGNVSNLNELYCNFDYMLQPTHMECFSLSILESLAANVPVITTNVGGNEEVVIHGKNGIIFEAKDSASLTKIITDIVSCKTKITTYTRDEIESNFSLEKMVENYYQLLL
jgi:glycosyltransferase involved in cell wall biosynthesis